MNKKGFIDTGLLLIIFLILCVIVYGYVVVTSNRKFNERRQFCIDKLGEGNYYTKTVGMNHMNCCWKEVFLNDEGFYEGSKCKGILYKQKDTLLNRWRANLD